jgi:hypothetical protein
LKCFSWLYKPSQAIYSWSFSASQYSGVLDSSEE